MGRTEVIILVSFALVGGGAIALESAGPSAVRIIGITACLVLVTLTVAGLVMRARVQKRRSFGAGDPGDISAPGSAARAASTLAPSARSDSPDQRD